MYNFSLLHIWVRICRFKIQGGNRCCEFCHVGHRLWLAFGAVRNFQKSIQQVIPTLSGLEISYKAALIIQNWLLFRLFGNIFKRLNISTEHILHKNYSNQMEFLTISDRVKMYIFSIKIFESMFWLLVIFFHTGDKCQ